MLALDVHSANGEELNRAIGVENKSADRAALICCSRDCRPVTGISPISSLTRAIKQSFAGSLWKHEHAFQR